MNKTISSFLLFSTLKICCMTTPEYSGHTVVPNTFYPSGANTASPDIGKLVKSSSISASESSAPLRNSLLKIFSTISPDKKIQVILPSFVNNISSKITFDLETWQNTCYSVSIKYKDAGVTNCIDFNEGASNKALLTAASCFSSIHLALGFNDGVVLLTYNFFHDFKILFTKDIIIQLLWSSNGRNLIICSRKSIYIIDAIAGKKIGKLPVPPEVRGIQWSSDENYLEVWTPTKIVRWDWAEILKI